MRPPRHLLFTILVLPALLTGCPSDSTPAAAPTPQPNPVGDTPFAAVSRTEIKTELTAVKKAAEAFRALEGKWPQTVDELIAGDFLKANASKDPWDRPYVIKGQGNAVTVHSYGADGTPGGQQENTDWDSGSAGLGVTGPS